MFYGSKTTIVLRLKGSHVARAAHEKNCGQVVVLFLMPSQPVCLYQGHCGQVVVLFLMPSQPVCLYQGHCGQVDNQKLRKINTDHYIGSASFSSCFVLLMLCTSKKKKDPFVTKRLEVVTVVLKLDAKNIYVHNPTNKHRYQTSQHSHMHNHTHTKQWVHLQQLINLFCFHSSSTASRSLTKK